MDRQKEIIKVFNKSEKTVLHKSEIIELGKISYYYNTNKHVGDVLSRMVKNGLLERPKKGYYKLTGRQNKHFNKDFVNDPNQTTLL